MKNKRLVLWIVLPIIIAISAGAILWAVTSQGITSLTMGENGVTLYSSNAGTLRADRVYIDGDGNACIDYTATAKGEDSLIANFNNVEINGWAMAYRHHYTDTSGVSQGERTGTCVIAEADILERSGITDIYDVRFDLGTVIGMSDYDKKTVVLTVKDAPGQAPAARVPVEGEQVLVDTDEFTFIAQTAGLGTAFGYDEQHYVQFYMENKTDRTLYADLQVYAVNDLSLAIFNTVQLTPGAKACLPYGLDTSDYTRYGMSTVDHIDFGLEVSDDDSNRVVENTDFELYFNGYTADTLPEYPRNAEETETVIYDDDRFTFIIFGAERFDDEMYMVHCYIENKTDEAITYSTEESTINGITVKNDISGYGMSPYRKTYDHMVFRPEASGTDAAVEEFRFTLDVTTSSEGDVIVSPDRWFEYQP
ncbi:MAG: hypothetical protein E7554_00750 [Ruminococcaceae bacterium]|nr:hypothetical protein [Oscillospiraceae bacterium]